MLLTEYDYDTDIAVQRQEAFDEGIQQGIQQGRSEGIQQGRSEGIQQGRSEGSQQAKIETAKSFLEMGLNIEQVVKGTGLPRETVAELAKGKK